MRCSLLAFATLAVIAAPSLARPLQPVAREPTILYQGGDGGNTYSGNTGFGNSGPVSYGGGAGPLKRQFFMFPGFSSQGGNGGDAHTGDSDPANGGSVNQNGNEGGVIVNGIDSGKYIMAFYKLRKLF